MAIQDNNASVGKNKEPKASKASKESKVSPSTLSTRPKSNGVIKASKEFGLRTLSSLVSRLQLANLAGTRFGGKRNLYSVFGYENTLTPEMFLAKYTRQDIASRVIDAPPDATWAKPPMMQAPQPTVDAWDELVRLTKLWGVMHRVDRLARLNPFALMLFGFDDGAKMDKPVGGSVRELLYVRAIGSRQVQELSFNSDTKSPRFGMPDVYKIQFDDPKTKQISSGAITVKGLSELTVHHSRVVHVTANPLEDVVFSSPIMEKVFNLLDDLLKVSGGTAEMFWLAGNRGIQADIDKDMEIDPADAAALSDEIEEYMHQLRRFIRTRGIKLNVLDSTVPDPQQVFEMIMSLISGTTGIPRRILLGSEAGQLASEQDRANWAERIEERRTLSTTPGILEPAAALLQRVSLLPEGLIGWEWPSAFIQNPLEEGQTMAQKARAIGNISRQTGAKAPMQLVSREEAREILGYEGDLDESDLYVPPPPPPPAVVEGDPSDPVPTPTSNADAHLRSLSTMTREDIVDIVEDVLADTQRNR